MAKDAGVSRFVYASSQSMYGVSNTFGELDEDDSEKNPVTAYAIAKWNAEQKLNSMTTGEVTKSLAKIGSILMSQIVSSLQQKEKISATEQNESLVTYAEKINKSEAKLNMSHTSEKILRKINSLNPYPGASIIFRDKILKIWRANLIEDRDGSKKISIGELYTYNEKLILKLENGVIQIMELQLEGKNRIDANSFIRGYNVTEIEKIN